MGSLIKKLIVAQMFGMGSSLAFAGNPEDVLQSHLNSKVSPSEDFFEYANGGWIQKNPIPADQSGWGIDRVIIDETQKRLKQLSETAASSSQNGNIEQKIGDFWASAMDEAKIEKQGLGPIAPLLAKIDSIQSIPSLVSVVIELKKIGSMPLFSDFVTQDDKQSDLMAYKLWQGGLGLPEREYYFKDDSATIEIRKKYVDFMNQLLTHLGEKNPDSRDLLAMETELAQISRKLEDLRDPYANYHKMKISDLSEFGQAISWPDYLRAMGVHSVDSVIVGQPEFFKGLDQILRSHPLSLWKKYLKVRLALSVSEALPDVFDQLEFDFKKLFSGAKERKPRWKRVIESEEQILGEALGQLYVKRYFTEAAKLRYSKMVEDIRDALKQRIQGLSWMGAATKEKAFQKLAKITKKVGYPDRWKDFSKMKMGRESAFQNLIEGRKWWREHELAKLGKPVDRTEWDMTPQTYNAYYNASNNEIVLPAAIFAVPGVKDEDLDDALVYGYVGASTIGHEITHGFDDEGRQFDAAGNLAPWWTKEDEDKFKERARGMVEQFNAIEPFPGYRLNGKATLGENIADLGGMLLGLEAFKKTKQYQEGKKIAGLLPMQRYFLGYALGWLGHRREEALRNQILTDVHAPAKWRVNAPVQNVEEFYSTFNVKPGSRMHRPDQDRVRIW